MPIDLNASQIKRGKNSFYDLYSCFWVQILIKRYPGGISLPQIDRLGKAKHFLF